MTHKTNVAFVSTITLLVLCNITYAQSQKTTNTLTLDKKENMPKVTVSDFAWLAGHWSGEGLGGTCEEIWAPPLGDNVIGLFRFLKDGKTQFTELFSLVKEGESLVLKLKHFNPDMTSWEEKDKPVQFPLVKVSPNEANFDGLTYRKKDDDTLDVFVAIKGKDGNLREEKFSFKRVKK